MTQSLRRTSAPECRPVLFFAVAAMPPKTDWAAVGEPVPLGTGPGRCHAPPLAAMTQIITDGVDPSQWPSMASLRRARSTGLRAEGHGSAVSQITLAEWRAFLLEMGASASAAADGKWKWTAHICDDRGSVVSVARSFVKQPCSSASSGSSETKLRGRLKDVLQPWMQRSSDPLVSS